MTAVDGLTRAELLDEMRGNPFSVTGSGGDYAHSVSSSVLRCVYGRQRAVAVGCDASAKTQIAALLDLLHLHNQQADTSGIHVDPDSVTLILGGAKPEALDALDTLRSNLRAGPEIHILDYQQGSFITPPKSTFDPADAATHYRRWDGLLRGIGEVPALVHDLVTQCQLPALRAYPMLTTTGFWSVRLEGLEVAQVNTVGGDLDVGSDQGDADDVRRSGARQAWHDATGNIDPQPLTATPESMRDAIAAITAFATRWRNTSANDTRIAPRQNEHALESRILRGQTPIHTSSGARLHLLRGFDQVVNWGSQFPTKWGTNGSARYLDALLRDGRTPWAVEMKVEGSAGVGKYYRHAIAQAVLYREFIRRATPLHWWFTDQDLDPTTCQAAVVIPSPIGRNTAWIPGLKQLCNAFDVDLIQVESAHAALHPQ